MKKLLLALCIILAGIAVDNKATMFVRLSTQSDFETIISKHHDIINQVVNVVESVIERQGRDASYAYIVYHDGFYYYVVYASSLEDLDFFHRGRIMKPSQLITKWRNQ